MMHSVVENKHKPITWAFKAITSVRLKGVTEQKVAQKQAGKKEKGREKALCVWAVLVSCFTTEV